MNFVILLHLFIAYLAFYKLGSISIRNPDLLMIFSLFYVFSGTMIMRIVGGAIFYVFAFAWLPLVYYFFFKIVSSERKNIWDYVFFIISFLLVYLTGVDYIFAFAAALIFIMTFLLLVTKKIDLKKLFVLIATSIIFLLLAAIRLIPSLELSDKIVRIDTIYPLVGGGPIESSISSFMFGTVLDTVYGNYESIALIGAIVVLLAIIALIWGKDWIIFPCFGAVIFSLLYADGGQTLLSFIHLFPVFDGFRCPGRIFGAAMPIVLLLAGYGSEIFIDKIRADKNFIVTESEKNKIKWGVITLCVLKVFELPFQQIPSVESIVSVLLIGIILGLFYFNKATLQNLKILISAALVLEIVLVVKNYPTFKTPFIISGFIILILITLVLFIWKSDITSNPSTRYFTAILLVSLLLIIIVNSSNLSLSDPGFDKSPALPVIEKMMSYNTSNSQIWVYESGWPVKHMDFTYWDIINGIHPMRAYYAYFLKDSISDESYDIGGVQYYPYDFYVDNAILDDGNHHLDNVTFSVNGIDVYRPDHVLPNVFVLRDNQFVPLKIEKFSSDEVIVTGDFKAGDIAVLKNSYYPGWKINTVDAQSDNNFIGGALTSSTQQIDFRFDPTDLKVGIICTCIGILLLGIVILKRKEIEVYLNEPEERSLPNKRNLKKKK
ncbi:hypothetical protein [Methanoregula sp.]|jgi:hypothetical protein|uniref:hypothetical protein n=1 Tax=Methanoregula sp. TaxID=2052170 RepID=UPI003C28AED3